MSLPAVLAFAENDGYLIQEQNDSFRRLSLPNGLETYLSENRITSITTCSFGEGGAFFCAWGDTGGNTGRLRWHSSLDRYSILEQYLEDQTNKDRFKFDQFNVSLGPGGSFYFYNGCTCYCSSGLDDMLKRDIERREPGDPNTVTLGVNGSYVLIGKAGDLLWDLKGQYGDLDDILGSAKSGVQTVKLSMFRNDEYFVAFQDGSRSWCLPSTWGMKA